MTQHLDHWDRPNFVRGEGDPFLFYVVFGEVNATTPLSRGKYRSNGIPDGMQLMSYGPQNHPEVPASFQQGYLWDEFAAEDPELAHTVSQSSTCMVLRGSPTDSSSLNYLRDIVGLITYFLEQGGCAAYDPLMFRWWNSADWKTTLFEPGAPVPLRHTVILTSEEDDPSLTWFHTRGLRKFGRPDISIHNVPEHLTTGAIALCNRLIEHQAQGQVVPDGQQIRMSSLPDGGVIHHAGYMDDPDFNNIHLDVKLFGLE